MYSNYYLINHVYDLALHIIILCILKYFIDCCLISIQSFKVSIVHVLVFLGKGLFCSKKPPKTEDSEDLLTHHQRKLVDLAKHHLFADKDCHKFAIHMSVDDKAYIRPGTSGIFT